MLERKAVKIEAPLSVADLTQSREKLEEAIERFKANLLMDIRVYLTQFNLTHLLDQTEEFYSELKIIALRNAGNYNPECSAKAWLRQAAVYMIKHLTRAENHQPKTTSISEAVLNFGYDGDVETSSESELFDYLEQRNVEQFFRNNKMNANEILSVVNTDDRKILEMRFISGYSTKEIAAHYGISENAADVRLSRAKNRLRREFLK